jgi:hypothetical protein|tara:strand:+ start:128 stop:742 length:615 start_codon:yes stop_codon:yes gene_type:complete
MKAKVITDSFFIGHYEIANKYIKDLNKRYEAAKNGLQSYGPRLAGRLDSELEMLNIIQSTAIFPQIVKRMDKHIKRSIEFQAIPKRYYDLEIIGCWINDMKAGEYNPPHTHHNGTGWSTVLFLEVPEFIDDAKDPHKFHDGALCFIMGRDSTYFAVPKVGDFYIFHARHQHCVMPFKTRDPKRTRRSMSFNFIANHREEKGVSK